METSELTLLERKIFRDMAKLNGTEPEMILETCHRNESRFCFKYFASQDRPPLTDIHPLAQLEGLTHVDIDLCDIKDISPLADISTLEDISIGGGSELLPCDFTPLKHLSSLSLHYERCIIPKVTGLPLEYVSFSTLNSLEGLEGLKKLKRLYIDDNTELSDLSPLASCFGLEYLSAVNTAVCDLTPLSGHSSLKTIVLSNTPVTDVSPLVTIPTLEMIWLYGAAVTDVSCLAALPKLNDLNLLKTQVSDLSAFQGQENILSIERKKLGIKKAGKSVDEIKVSIERIREKLDKLGITPEPPLKQDAINDFQEKNGVKLPHEYIAFLTQIGDGFEVRFKSFLYRFPPLAELKYDRKCIKKRFSHREGWCWEEDDSATDRKIAAATQNGQIELVDCGCGESFRLIVCGGAKGEVWDMSEVGIAPYGNGLDFLDWMNDFLDGKVIEG